MKEVLEDDDCLYKTSQLRQYCLNGGINLALQGGKGQKTVQRDQCPWKEESCEVKTLVL